MILIQNSVFQKHWVQELSKAYNGRLKIRFGFKKLIKKMIFVDNAKLFMCVAGNPDFTWKHKRALFIAINKEDYHWNDMAKLIISYLDIRYDPKLCEAYREDKKKYINCVKMMNASITQFQLSIDEASRRNLEAITNEKAVAVVAEFPRYLKKIDENT